MASGSEILVTAGVVSMLAAGIGGGMKAFGIELPAIGSVDRQVLIGVFGAFLLYMGLGPNAQHSSGAPNSQQTATRTPQEFVDNVTLEIDPNQAKVWRGIAFTVSVSSPSKDSAYIKISGNQPDSSGRNDFDRFNAGGVSPGDILSLNPVDCRNATAIVEQVISKPNVNKKDTDAFSNSLRLVVSGVCKKLS